MGRKGGIYMSAPYEHAKNSAKKFGGEPEDYLDIHELMDSTKAAFSDNRHRCASHNSWFTTVIIPKIFGHQRLNAEGKAYNTKDVAERHVLEDYQMKFIPTLQDWVEHLPYERWMNNGMGVPSRMQGEEKHLVRTDLTEKAIDPLTKTFD